MFQLNHDHVPDEFFRSDIRVESRSTDDSDDERHLIFSTPHQLGLLARAKSWHIDGTFKVVKKPFVQLFTIHGLVRADGEFKQVPLVFVLMSRRQTEDYTQVFEAIQRMVPMPLAVKEAILDFEKGIYNCLYTKS